jgi:hypothetical protein
MLVSGGWGRREASAEGVGFDRVACVPIGPVCFQVVVKCRPWWLSGV